MAEDGGSDFALTVAEEIEEQGMDCVSVDMLIDMANTGDVETVAMVLCDLVDQGNIGYAADICRQAMHVETISVSSPPDYSLGATLLGQMIQAVRLDAAVEVAKYMVVAKQGPEGTFYDCYDTAMVIGNMAAQSRVDWAAEICAGLYHDESANGGYASMVPIILGTLIDRGSQAQGSATAAAVPPAAAAADPVGLAWASAICRHLISATGLPRDADYSMVGWIMSQMVWSNRADWPARVVEELTAMRLQWFNVRHLLDSIASWSDPSYAHAVFSLIRRAPPPNRYVRPAVPPPVQPPPPPPPAQPVQPPPPPPPPAAASSAEVPAASAPAGAAAAVAPAANDDAATTPLAAADTGASSSTGAPPPTDTAASGDKEEEKAAPAVEGIDSAETDAPADALVDTLAAVSLQSPEA